MSRWIRLIILVGAILQFACANADPRLGEKWTPFHMVSPDGKPRDWAPGRVTVVAFCAYWCDTWKQQVPRLVGAEKITHGLPVDFVTVSVDGRWAEVAKNNQGLPLWLDRGGEWSRGQGVDRVPTTVVLAADGRVTYVAGAVLRTEDVVGAVHSALANKQEAGKIYLTFDDFPASEGGNELLDELRAKDVKATFFCMGSRVEAEAKLLKRALAEGHSLQMHSWDHDASNPQLDRCRAVFKRVLGITPTLYRPPGSEQIIGELAHHRIVDPYDFTRPTKKELMRRTLLAACPEAVIQLHAGVAVTLAAMPEIIENLKTRGYTFATL